MSLAVRLIIILVVIVSICTVVKYLAIQRTGSRWTIFATGFAEIIAMSVNIVYYVGSTLRRAGAASQVTRYWA
jgi:uncharacterized membrane protein (DUF4010 family)